GDHYRQQTSKFTFSRRAARSYPFIQNSVNRLRVIKSNRIQHALKEFRNGLLRLRLLCLILRELRQDRSDEYRHVGLKPVGKVSHVNILSVVIRASYIVNDTKLPLQHA